MASTIINPANARQYNNNDEQNENEDDDYGKSDQSTLVPYDKTEVYTPPYPPLRWRQCLALPR